MARQSDGGCGSWLDSQMVVVLSGYRQSDGGLLSS